MALPSDAYQELEDIVGPENISEEPVILDSYAFQYSAELSTDASKFMPRPEAVVLPGSTEEVQAIVRTCNRHRIKYKAFSTGWGHWGVPWAEGVIQLDMRRMDRILEIDEKNMFAVVEPYVIGATLQAEAMKVGLNTHMIGAGANCSPLAAATSMSGHGPDSISMGHASENLLALEWVLPNGDILRTGSLGSGDGWFCGEGPGPSLRGIARGWRGGAGGIGVFTKCAIKLSPWPGPAELSIQGTVPAYNSLLPENFRVYTIAVPSWEAYANAHYKIWDSEIGYITHRQFNMLGEELSPAFWILYNDPTKTLEDLEEFAKRPEIQKVTEELRVSFEIILAGHSPRDIEYQDKVLSEILAETGGWKVEMMSEPVMERFRFLYLTRLCFKSLNFVYTGRFGLSFAQMGTPDFVAFYAPIATEVMKQHQETGLLVKCGDDSMMGCGGAMGGGTYTLLEQFFFYDPHDKESVKEAAEYKEDEMRTRSKHGLPPGLASQPTALKPKEQRESIYLAHPQPAIYHWQRKIKQILDPNDTVAMGYDTLEETAK
jgi:glycolate oxidase